MLHHCVDCGEVRWRETVAIFWDIAPCNMYTKRHFGGTGLATSSALHWCLA
jgi:hypothetical protein